MWRILLIVSVLMLSTSVLTSVRADSSNRKSLADKHAPAGIMGDHLHSKGEWMVEYRYMNMYMDDNLIGDRRVTDPTTIVPTVVNGIPTNGVATPTDMTMEMHMVHMMYGASDDVTLYTMLMLPSLTMDHIRGPGNPSPAPLHSEFTTHNSGFGDIALGALLRLYSDEKYDLLCNLGCSVPTGDLFRTTTIPTGGPTPLPYPMRLGSGTFNARPGMTLKRFADWWSCGWQFQTDLPIGRNYRGYSIGNEFRINSWTSVLLTDWWSISFRGEHVWRANYDGRDPQTPDMAISTNVESFRGGYWYNMGFGTQLNLKGHYFNAEIVPNVHQDVNGIQLETDFSVIGSYSKAW